MNDEIPVVLKCEDVTKSYPIRKELKAWSVMLGKQPGALSIYALRGISMEVKRGKIMGVLGRNGAGKSTLLRVLGGVYEPTTGQVETHGKVAGLFELGGTGNPNLTGREYATRYLRIVGTPLADLPALLEDIVDFSELRESFNNRIRTYSSGMQARLYFATATALQHEIYLIDELLSVGDEHFQAKCWLRMRQRLLNGASGVLVTHDWAATLRLCEHTSLIERGRFAFTGPSNQAVVQYLDLQPPALGIARFSKANPTHYEAQSGADTEFEFHVDLTESAEVEFSMSIEVLRIGIGWEIVLLSAPQTVGCSLGRHVVRASIPRLPLAAGSYSLNIFLTRRKSNPLDSAVSLDSKTWTAGNGLSLVVSGKILDVAVRLPFSAKPILKGANESTN